VLRFNMQFGNELNLLRLSHESNKKAKKRETKQKKTKMVQSPCSY